ncbi:MAG: F0F1 ATP synthase subunit B [Dehalococcoidia bacterium]|nr:F0F1 ATP synthase subunit B [Dehalococcoidia bacterium]
MGASGGRVNRLPGVRPPIPARERANVKTLTQWTRLPDRLRTRATALVLGGVAAVVPAVASAAESSGGIAALGVNLPGLIAQLVNFTILLFVLRLFLFGPIMKIVDERRQKIEEGLKASEQAAHAAESSQEESRRILEGARAESREMVGRAQETANRLREELETQARRDAEQIVTRARQEIDAERQQAIQALRAEFADLTIRAAERVVGQSIDGATHQRLIDEVLVNSTFGQDGRN